MPSDLSQVERAILRAYERGRIKWAARIAAPLFALVAIGLMAAGRSLEFYVIALLLAITAGVYSWRGGDAGNALVPGLAAGMVPLVLSAIMLDCSAECSDLCMRHCVTVCASGAAIAGLLAAVLTRNHPRRSRAWVFAVALVPASGLLGCPHVGYGQLIGLVVGLLAAKAVVYAVDRRRGLGKRLM
jgi:hypothetical protein